MRTAYLAWRRARAVEAPLAFEAYEAALDREEVAAEADAALMRRVGHLDEVGLARELAYLPSIPERRRERDTERIATGSWRPRDGGRADDGVRPLGRREPRRPAGGNAARSLRARHRPGPARGNLGGRLNAAFVASRPQTVSDGPGARPGVAQPRARGHLPGQHERVDRRFLWASESPGSRSRFAPARSPAP